MKEIKIFFTYLICKNTSNNEHVFDLLVQYCLNSELHTNISVRGKDHLFICHWSISESPFNKQRSCLNNVKISGILRYKTIIDKLI